MSDYDDRLKVAMNATDAAVQFESHRLAGAIPVRRPMLPGVADIDRLLTDRKTIHGDFTDDAKSAQALKYIMRQGKNWDDMPDFMREALEQMQTKVARILAGDFRHPDHWKDLQGYPKLVEERL